METDTIRVITRTVLRRSVRCFDDDDEISVEVGSHIVYFAYTSTRATCGAGDVTRMKCSADLQRGQMWVDDLRVASRLRSNGLGRQLAAAAERIAGALGLRTLNAFPLVPARSFWTKMGYTSHPHTARMVKKDLRNDGPEAN